MKAPAVPVPSPAATPERKPGRGEPSKNYTKIPNAYWDLIEQNKLRPGLQDRILLIIMRLTWGASERPDYAPISLETFAQKCGGAMRGTISKELQDMADRGLIEMQASNGCKTALKLYRLCPVKAWRHVRPYEIREVEADNPELEPAEGCDKLTLEPSETTTVKARLTPPDREPIDFQIAYENAGEDAVEVSSSVASTVVRVVVRTANTWRSCTDPLQQTAEQKANAVSCRKQEQKANTDVDKRLTSFVLPLVRLFFAQFSLPFDPDRQKADQQFVKKVLAAAGPQLTPEFFEEFAVEQIRAMRRKHKPVEPGILIHLAKQAARAHQFREANAPPERSSGAMIDGRPFTDAELAEAETESRKAAKA